MKTKIICATICAAVLTFHAAQAEEKTLTEKTVDTLEKAKDKTVEAGKKVVKGTKKAVEKVKEAVTPDADATKVDVTLTEHNIDMPKTVDAGKTAFVVRNTGKQKHSFEIDGQGIDKRFLLAVNPGTSKVLHANLKPGTYTVACPMEGHEEKGMEMTLLVK